MLRRSSTASILKNYEGFRIIRRSNLNTMDSPETAISIWTDTESLNVTPESLNIVGDPRKYLLAEKL